MPFSWLHPHIPAHVKKHHPAAAKAMQRREISERASLLRRLGYSRDEALRRCQAYLEWEHEPFHRSPLAADIVQIVDDVYSPKVGRVTSLSPGT